MGNMGFGDYIVTMYNKNMSGVRDLYKYDAGNNYPCWDVLKQCSADGQSAGTMDLLDTKNERQNGFSVSSWNRALITGDAKDSEITPTDKKVMFAHGKNDDFTYHGKSQQITCSINFFTMETDCGSSDPPAPAPAPEQADQFLCTVCDHIYEPDADGEGLAFKDLDDSWVCPVCGQPKSVYKKLKSLVSEPSFV